MSRKRVPPQLSSRSSFPPELKVRKIGGMTPWWHHLWPAPDRGVLPHGKEERPFFCEGTRFLVGDHLSVVHAARPGKERLSTTL